MKPPIVFAAAFVVALGASTGVKVAMTKGRPARAAASDSAAKADSTRKAAAGDSTAQRAPDSTRTVTDSAHKDSTVKVAPPAVQAATAQTAAGAPNAGPSATPSAASTAASSAAAPTPTVPAAPDTMVQASERRIAKVFTSMDAKKAAEVLGHMADADVQIILGYVGPRQAAQIMAALPPERVAVLSKRAMQGKPQ